PGDIFVCTDIDFSGYCQHIRSTTYKCHNFAPEFRKKVSSIRPEKNQACFLYENDDCFGKSDWIRNPGSGNLRGRRFDNMATSWRCGDDDCQGAQNEGGCHENADGSPKS
ncbi:hypothetical protein GQ44DRAFT_575742, partial [Phaeosphaeriaceae sp. PMI808]